MGFMARPKMDRIGSKARDAMAEHVTSELILDHVTKIRGKFSEHDRRFARVESELRAIRLHVAGLVQSDLSRHADQASTPARLDRIEHRLRLTDASLEWPSNKAWRELNGTERPR